MMPFFKALGWALLMWVVVAASLFAFTAPQMFLVLETYGFWKSWAPLLGLPFLLLFWISWRMERLLG